MGRMCTVVSCLLSSLLCAHSQNRLKEADGAEKAAADRTMNATRRVAADNFETQMAMWGHQLASAGFMDLPVVAEGESLEVIQRKQHALSLLIVQLRVRTTALPMPIRQP
jgi:hypothetical protein